MAVAANIITATRATTTNKPMRLITLYPFLTTPTQRFMSQAVSGRMCVCGGWAHCVCLYLATNKRPAPCLFRGSQPRLFSCPLSFREWDFAGNSSRCIKTEVADGHDYYSRQHNR